MSNDLHGAALPLPWVSPLNILSSWILYWCFHFVFNVLLLHPHYSHKVIFFGFLLASNLVENLLIVVLWNIHIFSIYYYDESTQIIVWLNQITMRHSENRRFPIGSSDWSQLDGRCVGITQRGVRRTASIRMPGIHLYFYAQQ